MRRRALVKEDRAIRRTISFFVYEAFHMHYILSFFLVKGLYIDVAVFGKKCYTMHEMHEKKFYEE